MRTRSHRWLPAIALTAGVVLAGCADDEPAATTDAAQEASSDEAADEDDDAATDVVEVGLVDFGFTGLPGSVAAGTQLTVVNDAEAELHELVAFRLADDEDREVAELAQLPPDELLGALGEPEAVLLAAPGGPQIAAVGDGTLDAPGRYAVMCFIPTGADPDEYLAAAETSDGGPPQVDGGPPHVANGMFGELVVE